MLDTSFILAWLLGLACSCSTSAKEIQNMLGSTTALSSCAFGALLVVDCYSRWLMHPRRIALVFWAINLSGGGLVGSRNHSCRAWDSLVTVFGWANTVFRLFVIIPCYFPITKSNSILKYYTPIPNYFKNMLPYLLCMLSYSLNTLNAPIL